MYTFTGEATVYLAPSLTPPPRLTTHRPDRRNGVFYPRKLPQHGELKHYRYVDINADRAS